MADDVKVPKKDKNRGFQLDVNTQPFKNFLSNVQANVGPAFRAQQIGPMAGMGGFAASSPRTTTTAAGASVPSLLGTGTLFLNRVNQSQMDTGRTPFSSAGGEYDPSFEQWLAMRQGGGSGGGRPDLSAYRAALTDQANQINAQIQAMYRALGDEAAANLGRIQDVYGGAQTGVGNIYGSATENIGQAYGSAQQQAADQMARLGIEAAAPQVVNPMALSQAEAVAGLEQGRAGGLSALERYGATAKDFASQMAQTAQQQGTEMNAAILASLQNRLMDTLAAEQSGGGGGGGGMSVRDQVALRDLYNQEVLGQLPLEERQFAFDVAQAAAAPANEYNQWRRDKFVELTTPQRSGQRPLFTPEEAQAYLNALDSYAGPSQ